MLLGLFGCMPLFGRIRDAVKAAWNVLWGRSEVQIRMARIERDWLAIEVEVSAMFDNVNALLARIAKRKRREETDQPALAVAPDAPTGNGKLDIRRRIQARQGRTPRAPSPLPEQQETA